MVQDNLIFPKALKDMLYKLRQNTNESILGHVWYLGSHIRYGMLHVYAARLDLTHLLFYRTQHDSITHGDILGTRCITTLDSLLAWKSKWKTRIWQHFCNAWKYHQLACRKAVSTDSKNKKQRSSVLHFYGSWSSRNNRVKGYARPGSQKKIQERMMAPENDHLLVVDEYNTTKTCGSCLHRVELYDSDKRRYICRITRIGIVTVPSRPGYLPNLRSVLYMAWCAKVIVRRSIEVLAIRATE